MRACEPPPRCPLRRWRFGDWTGQSYCPQQAPGETARVSQGLRRPIRERSPASHLRPPSVRCPQPAHGEFDLAVRKLAPAFAFTHVRSLGILLQKPSRLRAGFLARKSKCFPHETVRRTRSPGHSVGKVPRSKRHAANSNKLRPCPYVGRAGTNPSPSAFESRFPCNHRALGVGRIGATIGLRCCRCSQTPQAL